MGISWDKFRKLMGRKSKDHEMDSSKFQKSYSFKRGSVRKSGRRTAVGVAVAGSSSNKVQGVAMKEFSEPSSSPPQPPAVPPQTKRHGGYHAEVNVNVVANNGSDATTVLDTMEGKFEVEYNCENNLQVVKKLSTTPPIPPLPPPSFDQPLPSNDYNSNIVMSTKKHFVLPHQRQRSYHNHNGSINEIDQLSDSELNCRWTPKISPIGRKQRAENIKRLMSTECEDDSEWIDCPENATTNDTRDEENDTKCHKESGIKARNKLRLNDLPPAVSLLLEEGEADSEICEDEFLAMLAGSPKPLRRSTDSALSRLTSSESGNTNSNASRSRSQLGSDYSGKCGSRSRLSASALDLVEEAEKSQGDVEHKSDRSNLKNDSDKYNDDAPPDKNLSLLDSGCYNYSRAKLSITAVTSPYPSSSSSDSKSHNNPNEMCNKHLSQPLLSYSPTPLERTKMISSSSLSILAGTNPDPETPRSFWWTQKPGSTMTTSSGASKDSGFSLGRTWAWGIASRMFGKKSRVKGPVLSVSKEGYFQRTNLKRSSVRKPTYPVLRSSGARRSSGRLRKSGKKKQRLQNPSRQLGLGVGQLIPASSMTSLIFHEHDIFLARQCTNVYEVEEQDDSSRNRILPSYAYDPFVFVAPERRKNKHPEIAAQFKGRCSEIRFPFHFEQDGQEKNSPNDPSFACFEEIRLPRLRCESRQENVVITKVTGIEEVVDSGEVIFNECQLERSSSKNNVFETTDEAKVWNEDAVEESGENTSTFRTGEIDKVCDRLSENVFEIENKHEIQPELEEGTSSSIPNTSASTNSCSVASNEKENVNPTRGRCSSKRQRTFKVIAKPSVTVTPVHRRHSTLYRKAKLGPNFALPRPTVKIGKDPILSNSAHFMMRKEYHSYIVESRIFGYS